jgi:hypothetical protein
MNHVGRIIALVLAALVAWAFVSFLTVMIIGAIAVVILFGGSIRSWAYVLALVLLIGGWFARPYLPERLDVGASKALPKMLQGKTARTMPEDPLAAQLTSDLIKRQQRIAASDELDKFFVGNDGWKWIQIGPQIISLPLMQESGDPSKRFEIDKVFRLDLGRLLMVRIDVQSRKQTDDGWMVCVKQPFMQTNLVKGSAQQIEDLSMWVKGWTFVDYLPTQEIPREEAMASLGKKSVQPAGANYAADSVQATKDWTMTQVMVADGESYAFGPFANESDARRLRVQAGEGSTGPLKPRSLGNGYVVVVDFYAEHPRLKPKPLRVKIVDGDPLVVNIARVQG